MTKLFVYKADGRTLVKTIIPEGGRLFYAELAPGSYVIKVENFSGCAFRGDRYVCSNLYGSTPIKIDIVAGTSKTLTLETDTGIR